jgi:quercetin dioxygenase-like cupin family protein
MWKDAQKFCLSFGLSSLILSSGAFGETGPVVKFPADIPYGPAAEGRPQIAQLYGDPAKPGFYILRMKFPAGTKIVPHTHPEEVRTLTVLSGTLYFGFGDTWDDAAAKPFPPGTFFTETPTSPHFVWAKDEDVIVQVSGIGPSGFNPVK